MKHWMRKIQVFLRDHWIVVAAVVISLILVVMSTVGIMLVDSYQRISLLASMPLWILVMLISGAITAFIYVMVMFGYMSSMRKTQIRGAKVDVHFSDVLGIEESKEEAWEVVQLIKDHTLLTKIGGKILRGILMIGPPGCGKTYLAKAIATECGIPFMSLAASEFVEVFVGVGASRVRKLFKNARRLAYSHGGCIVFIDEIDAVGRSRTFSWMGGQETNSTLNQLLVEMDGLTEQGENVIVIAATNAEEATLDVALLRPGRFDRKIYIDRPNLEGREQLFAYYLKKVKTDETINVGSLARKAVYKSPADIENIVKEAALIATRKRKETVGQKEISEAIERIELGVKHKKKLTPREREMTAYHEAGHLITTYILHPNNDVFKASIIARIGTLGVVHPQPREEIFSPDMDKYLADIKVSLSGYVAEKLRFGVTTSGVQSDFKQAMYWAHKIVWQWGMGLSGHIGDYTVIPAEQLSEDIKQRLNEETNQILKKCAKDVETLLKKERVLLERFVKELLEKDELDYDEIEAIFKEFGKNSDHKGILA